MFTKWGVDKTQNVATLKVSNNKATADVYFDQHLGAVHSKRWWKCAFSLFLCKKAEKARNLMQNLS